MTKVTKYTGTGGKQVIETSNISSWNVIIIKKTDWVEYKFSEPKLLSSYRLEPNNLFVELPSPFYVVVNGVKTQIN